MNVEVICAMVVPQTRRSGMTDERLSWHLHNWAVWMRGGGSGWRRLWYPSKASGGMGRSHRRDFDEMVGDADRYCARATDACIDDLPQRLRLAIHQKLLSSVYRTRSDIEADYAEGIDVVRKALMKKGID